MRAFGSFPGRRSVWALLFAVLLFGPLCQAQPPEGRNPEGRHPEGMLLPHPVIRPPKGKTPAPGESTVVDATGLGTPIVLDHNWRVGIAPGKEPADPNFDDSKWPIRDAKEALADINESDFDDSKDPPATPKGPRPDHPHGHGPFAWFRIHVRLPEHHAPLVLFVRLPVSRPSQSPIISESVGMDLFANGQQVTPEGPNAASPEAYQQISRIYPIDIPGEQTNLVLAVRIPFVSVGMDAYTGFFANRAFLLGDRTELHHHLDLWRHAVLFERLPTVIDSGLKLLLALFLLALFWTQRDHPEYLWLGLHMATVAPLAYVDLIGSNAEMEKFMMAACVIELLLVSAYFYFEFLVAFLTLRRRWYIVGMRVSAPLLLTVGPLLFFVRQGKVVVFALVASILFATFWIIAWVVFTAVTLTVAAFRKNYEAALLLLPLVLSLVGMMELMSTAAANSWLNGPVQSPLTFQAGPVPIHFSSVADFVGVFVIILIVFVRFQRIHRERERASNELAAARSVQELMIPRESPRTPGFHVDTVYTPANEVGGDFFHLHATGDGGLLVVIGDVAGHGLQAAMNVSMLMGALRRSPQTSPGELLGALNEVLVGSSSFTTCEVAYFAADGELTIASAGHPPPYLNSQEVMLPGGLPLGVTEGVVYEETRLYLHPGDRLLMMSDGVAEARKPNGELFGFDRVRNLSNQSAFFIADAAKEFGQEDDITVLTIRRLAQAAAA